MCECGKKFMGPPSFSERCRKLFWQRYYHVITGAEFDKQVAELTLSLEPQQELFRRFWNEAIRNDTETERTKDVSDYVASEGDGEEW